MPQTAALQVESRQPHHCDSHHSPLNLTWTVLCVQELKLSNLRADSVMTELLQSNQHGRLSLPVLLLMMQQRIHCAANTPALCQLEHESLEILQPFLEASVFVLKVCVPE